jgi:hypothetical protein
MYIYLIWRSWSTGSSSSSWRLAAPQKVFIKVRRWIPEIVSWLWRLGLITAASIHFLKVPH